MSRRPGYILGDHWLEVAFSRICAGDQEQNVMADYGWVQITDAERDAIATAAAACEGIGFDELPATLRGLLARMK